MKSTVRGIPALALIGLLAAGGSSGCTQEEVDAVLAGIQIVANEIDQEDEVSFRDWLSSELDD